MIDIKKLCALFLLILFIQIQGFSQTGPPATDIYLFDLSILGSKFHLSEPLNITNRDGYDNQPMFSTEGLLYTSVRVDGQADIYQYNIQNKTTTQLTQTKESEYSPTITPDGRYFSVIRVEADSSQRLWKFPLTGGRPFLLLEDIKPVGYQAWADENKVALFILGNPNSLHIADIRTGKSQKVIDSIGRSLHKRPGHDAITFIHKVSAEEWWIKQIDIETHKIIQIVQTLDGSEDYAWTPNGILLMAKDSRLFKCNPVTDKKWLEIADLSKDGLHQITRIVVNPLGNKLAVVSSKR